MRKFVKRESRDLSADTILAKVRHERRITDTALSDTNNWYLGNLVTQITITRMKKINADIGKKIL
jgi:hypothetical protein